MLSAKKEGYPERKGTEEREEEYERDKQGKEEFEGVYGQLHWREGESSACLNNFCIS